MHFEREPSLDSPSRTGSRATITTLGTINDTLSSPQRRNTNLRVPELQWHKEYDEIGVKKARVLMIDYHRRDAEHIRRVEAQEFSTLEDLKKVYKTERTNTCLRVFHVQNCDWATNYLLRKFKLDKAGSRTQEFARWVKDKHPKRRGGKPMMAAKTWRTHSDPWRGVARTAFGMDYMKHFTCDDREAPVAEDRVLGLQGFDMDENPIHAYDIYCQRVSVYIQYRYAGPVTPDPALPCPYGDHPDQVVRRYDNGNTIIIFDNSKSHSIEDTLMTARGMWESKWRRLPFTMVHPTPSDLSEEDAQVNITCMKSILQDVFMSVVRTWEEVLDVSWEHVSILEDAIYERPADESRAPALWENQAYWLRYEKLMFYHVDTVTEMRKYLAEMVEGDAVEVGSANNTWLDDVPSAFDKLGNLIQEDLVKPTANLSELMYRSVGIRDSRASLQLGTSMWRLSWITFIFLPLTFIVGFFGMNVDTFQDGAPSMKWFFIAAIPFLVAVLLGWYILKHLLARHRRAPFQRGIYEALFSELQESHPNLWSRQGPREGINPEGWKSRLKWWLIQRWTNEKSLPKRTMDAEEPIGAWNRVKRWLIRRWTREIVAKKRRRGEVRFEDLELGEALTLENNGNGGAEPHQGLPGLGTVIVTNEEGKDRVVGGEETAANKGINESGGWKNRSHERAGVREVEEGRLMGHIHSENQNEEGESTSSGRNSGLLVEEQKEGEEDVVQKHGCEHRHTV